jgi:hypothetical protein
MVDAQPAEQVNLNGFARPVTAFSITRLKPKSAAQDRGGRGCESMRWGSSPFCATVSRSFSAGAKRPLDLLKALIALAQSARIPRR